jgi:hypothetical protein
LGSPLTYVTYVAVGYQDLAGRVCFPLRRNICRGELCWEQGILFLLNVEGYDDRQFVTLPFCEEFCQGTAAAIESKSLIQNRNIYPV